MFILRIAKPLDKPEETYDIPFKRQYKKTKNAILDDLRKLGCFDLRGKENFFKVRKCLPTGILALDLISARDIEGVYGLPFGKQIEIAGKQDSGKTSLALQIAAAAQAAGYEVLWIETEDTLSEKRAAVFGADIERFMLAGPDYLEQALSLIKKAVLLVPTYDSKNYSPKKGLVIIFDSVAATPTKYEYKPPKKEDNEEEFYKSQVAEFARIMSRYQRKIKNRIAKRNVLIVYINQHKDKIGQSWGDKVETYGGNALRFHCAIRMATDYAGRIVKKVESSDGEEVTDDKEKKRGKIEYSGIKMHLRNKKNKVLQPWGVVYDLEYLFNSGFNKIQGLLYALEEKGYAVKKGTKYIIHNFDTSRTYTLSEFEKEINQRPYLVKKLTESLYAV